MAHNHSTTFISHVKGKHLSCEDRYTIQIRFEDGHSIRSIAREIGCLPSTVSNEIKRGWTPVGDGHGHHYKAEVGQATYQAHKSNGGRRVDFIIKADFIAYVNQHFIEDKWSLDACAGQSMVSGEFSKEEIVCTKTLYNYVNLGLMDFTTGDLPDVLRRREKKLVIRKNKRKLGRSIEERPPDIDTREEFGHWECDLVIGSKVKDDQALLTLLERKSREFLMIPIADKAVSTVLEVFLELREWLAEHFSEVFKTVTTDNGSEFADLSQLETFADTLVYFAHPYSSFEKGSIERHNGLIRRFIPKGKRID